MGRTLETLGSSVGWFHERCPWASKLANIVSCCAMIGSAIFDPVSATKNHRYCNPLLLVFALSATVWYLLNIDALFRAGRFTGPLGLALLLAIAIFAEPLHTDLVAWLPLYFTVLSLVTALVTYLDWPTQSITNLASSSGPADLESQTIQDPNSSQNRDDVRSLYGDVAHNTTTPAIVRWAREPLVRYILGGTNSGLISSSCSRYTKFSAPARTVTTTTLSLSSNTAHVRPSWGARVLGFWLDPLALKFSRQQDWRQQLSARDLGDDFQDFESGRYHDDDDGDGDGDVE